MSARVQGEVVRRARSRHLAAIKPSGRTPRIEDSVASTQAVVIATAHLRGSAQWDAGRHPVVATEWASAARCDRSGCPSAWS